MRCYQLCLLVSLHTHHGLRFLEQAAAPLVARAPRRRLSVDYQELAKLVASDAAADDYFGFSVAIDGSTVVVGAQRKDSYRGAVYVLRTTDGGATNDQVAKLTAADAGSQDHLGYSVAIAGDVVVVGSSNEAAYIFSPHVATAESAALGSDSATRAGGTFLALLATVLAL